MKSNIQFMKKNKGKRIVAWLLILVCCFSLLTGCKAVGSYNIHEPLSISSTVNLPIVRPAGMADENAVIPYDSYIYDDSNLEYEAGLLINETKHSVVSAVNPHKRIYPASMTKILTGIVVMEAIESGQISMSDTVVVGKKIEFNEDNVAVLGLQPGDYITVEELMYGLLISSYNDCAILLARYISGSVSGFVDLMNSKAAQLGATNSHFVNPHGLHDNNHYTTPYDLYLIFKEFLRHDKLVYIDSHSTYDLTMHREDEKLTIPLMATNAFLSNAFDMPTGYEITGWKTGTTEKAGSCIILEFVSQETNEAFICLVSNAENHDALYQNVEDMLREIY